MSSRSPLLRLGVIGLCVAVLLSGCDALSSPAAVVNGHRISVDELRAQVEASVSEEGGLERPSEEGRKEIARRVLAYLIQLEVMRQYGDAHGFSVAPGDFEAEFERLIESAGGEKAFEQILERQGITEAFAHRIAEYDVLVQRVVDSLVRSGEAQAILEAGGSSVSASLTEAERQDAFGRWMTAQLGAPGIEVSPRFGRLDPGTGQIQQLSSTSE